MCPGWHAACVRVFQAPSAAVIQKIGRPGPVVSSPGVTTHAFVKLTSRDLQWLPALTNLLIDNVHQGATLGFLAPLSRYQARGLLAWGVRAAGPASRAVDRLRVRGTRPLAGRDPAVPVPAGQCAPSWGGQRLMVHSQERSRGVAGQLMARVETAAATQGRFLLQLETCADSQAEAVFAHLGWQRAGQIPDHCHDAEGQLRAAALYWKRLPHLV
ncbi:acetyltransferase (GNAT) domain-containing protein [Ditylenchus destructor]|nr:acetyltransferase (GNAT) domain-containing protein [Ditylenchus destructor]